MAAERQAKGTVSFWYWTGSTLVFLLLLSLQIVWFYAMRGPEQERSLEAGQRLLYSIKTGELVGTLASKEPKDAVPETLEATSAPAATTDTPPAHAAEEPASLAEQASQPAAVTATAPRWQRAARPVTAAAGKPMVAIIVTGLGLSRSTTDQALTLPPDVTLSFSPYAHDIAGWIEKSSAVGFENWLDVPMEPEDYPYSDPGPQGLLTSQDGAAIGQRISWVQQRSQKIVGLVSPVKEKFTEAQDATHTALMRVTEAELLFVRGKPSASEPYLKARGAAGVLPMPQTLEIDAVITASDIDRMLDELAKKAKADGAAIGIARPYPVTMRQITAWARALESKGVVLVPASALALTSSGAAP